MKLQGFKSCVPGTGGEAKYIFPTLQCHTSKDHKVLKMREDSPSWELQVIQFNLKREFLGKREKLEGKLAHRL